MGSEGQVRQPSRTHSNSSGGEAQRNSNQEETRFNGWLRAAKRGAVWGLGTGLLASGVALGVAWRCLPFYITYPLAPWPWYCTQPAYAALGYLAFPVNRLTNDLALAIALAPLTWGFYALLGGLIGLILSRIGSPGKTGR